MYKTSADIRKKFIEYFKQQGHTEVASSSLVPANDATLLFTNAGMVQFKDVFLGKEKRNYTRAVTCQRCLRAGGKHNDLENVGYTTRHHTFFEMLGNFSFGDYFKKEAIHYAWEFLTSKDWLHLDPNHLWITVHEKDNEAAKLWEEEFKKSGKRPQGISRCGDADNFWAMGETGPCGYCSEIFYDHGATLPGASPPADGKERYVEIWNLVFMQFERDIEGHLTPLPKPSVDTGMGLERITAALQGTHDNYQTKEFNFLNQEFKLILTLAQDSVTDLKNRGYQNNKEYDQELKIAQRVVTDHIRAIVFLLADGIVPSNESRGYILRSIIRRATYHLYMVGAYKKDDRKYWLADFAATLIACGSIKNGHITSDDSLASAYPELQIGKKLDLIQKQITQEEKQFLETLDRGTKIFDQEIKKIKNKIIPGTIVFLLHDTYGFPAVLTTEIAKSRGLTIDHIGFEEEMNKQRERSRAANKFSNTKDLKLNLSGTTKFIGYEQIKSKAKIVALFSLDETKQEKITEHEDAIIVLDQTPFYAESGGQVGDSGTIITAKSEFKVTDTKKYGTLILHFGTVNKGSFATNEEITATIDLKKRQAIKLNHSATHLLHQAIQKILGSHATQRGSLVDEKHFRFDFAHPTALTKDELTLIEDNVNRKIRSNLKIETKIQSLETAKKEGAMALFGEKYGDEVRVVEITDISRELCGGTHVNYTGEIGFCKIMSEESVAAGIRRITGVTGENALNFVHHLENILQENAMLLKVNREQTPIKLQQLIEEKSVLEKNLATLKHERAEEQIKNVLQQSEKIAGINLLIAHIPDLDNKTLRKNVEQLKQKFAPAIILLATIDKEKIAVVVGVSADICEKFPANKILQEVTTKINGSGGGRADFAQGGGVNIIELDNALLALKESIKNRLI